MPNTPVTNPPAPGTDEWERIITASKVPSLMRNAETGEYLGLGYRSARQIFLKEKMDITPELNELFTRGHAIEPYAINMWLSQNPGWHVSACNETELGMWSHEVAYTNKELPFKNQATLDGLASHINDDGEEEYMILECKAPVRATAPTGGWLIQVQAQMLFAGVDQATIIIAPRYGDMSMHLVKADPAIHAWITSDVEAFLALTEPPEETDLDAVRETVAALNPTFTPKTECELGELGEKWVEALKVENKASEELKKLEVEIMKVTGGNSQATFNGEVVMKRGKGRFAKSRFEDKALLNNPAYQTQVSKLDEKKLMEDYPDMYARAVAPAYTFQRKNWL